MSALDDIFCVMLFPSFCAAKLGSSQTVRSISSTVRLDRVWTTAPLPLPVRETSELELILNNYVRKNLLAHCTYIYIHVLIKFL